MDAELRSRTQEERLQRELELKFSFLDKQKRVVFEGLNREQQKWRRHFLRYQLQIEMNAASKLGDIKGRELFRQLSKLSRNLSQKAEHEVVAFLKKMRGLDGTQRLRRSRGLEYDRGHLIRSQAGSNSSSELSVPNWNEDDQNEDSIRSRHLRSDIGNDLNWTLPNQIRSEVTSSIGEFERVDVPTTDLLTPKIKNDSDMVKHSSPADPGSPAPKAERIFPVITPPLLPSVPSRSTIPDTLPLLLSPQSRLTHSTPQNNLVLATHKYNK